MVCCQCSEKHARSSNQWTCEKIGVVLIKRNINFGKILFVPAVIHRHCTRALLSSTQKKLRGKKLSHNCV
jgi:hypothetical protein